MVQAARSGRQNIAEGSRASATSSHTELRLLNVARASFEELLLDFEDYLRHRRLAQWAPDSREAAAVRYVPRKVKKNQTDQSDRTDLINLSDQERWTLYTPWLEHKNPAVRANALICLINQANYLLDQQIAALEKQFVQGGGYSEQLAAARLVERSRKNISRQESAALTDAIPSCPQCGGLMVLRTSKTGKNPGKQFWGCADYPACKGVLKL